MFLGTLLFFSAREKYFSAQEKYLSAQEKYLSAQEKYLSAQEKYLSAREKNLSAREIVWLSFPAFTSAAVASLLLGFAGEGCRRVLRLGGFVVGSAGHDEI